MPRNNNSENEVAAHLLAFHQERLRVTPDLSRAWSNVMNDLHPTKADLELVLSLFLDSWSVIESFEQEIDDMITETAVVNVASHAILEREGDDGKQGFVIETRGVLEGTFDHLAAYPRLCGACNNIIRDEHSDDQMKSNAHVVLGFISGFSSIENVGGRARVGCGSLGNNIKREAFINIDRAIELNGTDWRLHAMLASRHMGVYNTSRALDCIVRALELTTDPYAQYVLSMRRGKILYKLNQYDEAIDAFENTLRLYESGLKNHPSLTDKALGRLAIAEYMLVITLAKKGKNSEAAKHFRNAEKKRKSIDQEVSKTLDWGNQIVAVTAVSRLDAHLLSGGECDHCDKNTGSSNLKRCGGCKIAFYCSKECQKAAWKSGHKADCNSIQARNELAEDSCTVM